MYCDFVDVVFVTLIIFVPRHADITAVKSSDRPDRIAMNESDSEGIITDSDSAQNPLHFPVVPSPVDVSDTAKKKYFKHFYRKILFLFFLVPILRIVWDPLRHLKHSLVIRVKWM